MLYKSFNCFSFLRMRAAAARISLSCSRRHLSSITVGDYRSDGTVDLSPGNKKLNSIAVLIDGDSTDASLVSKCLSEIKKVGKIAVKRVYADWTKLPTISTWPSEVLIKYSLKQVQAPSIEGPESTRFALAEGAIDLLQRNIYDGYCIVSNNSDFRGLAERMREESVFFVLFGKLNTSPASIDSKKIETANNSRSENKQAPLVATRVESVTTKSSRSEEEQSPPASRLSKSAVGTATRMESETTSRVGLRSHMSSSSIIPVDNTYTGLTEDEWHLVRQVFEAAKMDEASDRAHKTKFAIALRKSSFNLKKISSSSFQKFCEEELSREFSVVGDFIVAKNRSTGEDAASVVEQSKNGSGSQPLSLAIREQATGTGSGEISVKKTSDEVLHDDAQSRATLRASDKDRTIQYSALTEDHLSLIRTAFDAVNKDEKNGIVTVKKLQNRLRKLSGSSFEYKNFGRYSSFRLFCEEELGGEFKTSEINGNWVLVRV